MLLTEEEAAGRWCPHVRLPAQFQAKAMGGVVAVAATSVNVGAHPIKNTETTRNATTVNCIGSKCSQWRWMDPPPPDGLLSKRRGYCGLAGAAML